MKQLLFLLLFPCLALAQYQGNAGQKITLGEQTSADGLVFRGVASIDTVTATSKITRANKQDTSAFILLDTVTNLLWHYKTGSNGWIQAGGGVSVSSFSAGTTGLTPSTATTGAVTLGGTLSVANGGTGATSLTPNNYLIRTNSSGVFDTAAIYEASGNVGIGTSSPSSAFKLTVNSGSNVNSFLNGDKISFSRTSDNASDIVYLKRTNDLGSNGTANIHGYDGVQFRTQGPETVKAVITDAGNLGIGTASPTEKLHVVGNARITAVGALGGNSATLYRNSDGVLSTTSSDINKKHNVRSIIYGLTTINKLNPVNFQWNVDESEDIGFIAQDIQNIIPESIETDWDSNLIFKYEKLIPILTKAIQEQQALIKALEQRILILENK